MITHRTPVGLSLVLAMTLLAAACSDLQRVPTDPDLLPTMSQGSGASIQGQIVFSEGFESGIPAGWTVSGVAGTSGAATNIAPTEGASFAFLDTRGDTPSGFGGTAGTTLQSPMFAAAAGDTIRLDFNFLTNDGGFFADFLAIQLRDAASAVVATLANGNTTVAFARAVPAVGGPAPAISPGVILTPPTAFFDGVGTGPVGGVGYGPGKFGGGPGGATGFITTAFVVPTSGMFELFIAVSDFGNRAVESGLAIDNIAVVRPNSPPVADAGPDQTVECTGFDGTQVALDGSGSSDPDGDALTYTWTDADGNVIATGATPTVTLPLGVHSLTLTVSDGQLEDSDDVEITVRDTTAPSIAMTVSPTQLWPPNHTMRLVARRISASDICDPAPTLAVSVTSTEPENGMGDGDTAPDWEVVANGDGTFNVWLRAERSGNGSDRLYRITATARDASGNTASRSATVIVPHDLGKSAK